MVKIRRTGGREKLPSPAPVAELPPGQPGIRREVFPGRPRLGHQIVSLGLDEKVNAWKESWLEEVQADPKIAALMAKPAPTGQARVLRLLTPSAVEKLPPRIRSRLTREGIVVAAATVSRDGHRYRYKAYLVPEDMRLEGGTRGSYRATAGRIGFSGATDRRQTRSYKLSHPLEEAAVEILAQAQAKSQSFLVLGVNVGGITPGDTLPNGAISKVLILGLEALAKSPGLDQALKLPEESPRTGSLRPRATRLNPRQLEKFEKARAQGESDSDVARRAVAAGLAKIREWSDNLEID